MNNPASKLLAAAIAMSTLQARTADGDQYVTFASEHLAFGQSVWMETCEGCHGYGIAGAPVPMRPAQWRDRVAKPRPMLYDHAINGFFGPDDTYMPERGGNTGLSDNEVRAAVDYMVALATFYIEKTGETK